MQAERLRLDMTAQIKQFYKWIIDNNLTATEISLWHALMHIADDAEFPIWLSVPISRLESLTGMKKDAIYKARDRLENKARIEVKLGKGNQAARYRLIPFGEEDENIEPDQIPAIEDIPEEIIEEPTEQPPVVPGGRPLNIFRRTQELIPMPLSTDIHHIRQFLDEGMEDSLLCEAVDITLENKELRKPMDRWKYFRGIIRNWYNNGIKTIEEYQKHEVEREERINNGVNKQSDRTIWSEPEQKDSGIREFRIPGQ